jgi:hypothetical protein
MMEECLAEMTNRLNEYLAEEKNQKKGRKNDTPRK